jgi:hypothetical protein
MGMGAEAPGFQSPGRPHIVDSGHGVRKGAKVGVWGKEKNRCYFFFRAIREIRRIDIPPRPCPMSPTTALPRAFLVLFSKPPVSDSPTSPPLQSLVRGFALFLFFVKKRLFSSFFGQK